MRMIDTHLHTIELTALPYPWLADFAPLRKDFPAAAYEAEARRCGVTDALAGARRHQRLPTRIR